MPKKKKQKQEEPLTEDYEEYEEFIQQRGDEEEQLEAADYRDNDPVDPNLTTDSDDYEIIEDNPSAQNKNQREYVEVMYGKQSEDRSIYEIQSDDIIREIEISYRGLKYDPEKGKYYKSEENTPVMSDKGVNEIIKILKSLLHKGIFMTQFKPEEANRVFRNIGRAINIKLSCNWRVWNISGIDGAIMIYNELLANIKAGINRAINSDEKHYREKAMGYNVGMNGKLDSKGNEEMFVGGI